MCVLTKPLSEDIDVYVIQKKGKKKKKNNSLAEELMNRLKSGVVTTLYIISHVITNSYLINNVSFNKLIINLTV